MEKLIGRSSLSLALLVSGLCACQPRPPREALPPDDLGQIEADMISSNDLGGPPDLGGVDLAGAPAVDLAPAADLAPTPIAVVHSPFLIASAVIGGLLYGYDIGSGGANGLHIASIATGDGAVAPLVDDAASYALDIQLSSDHVYWMQGKLAGAQQLSVQWSTLAGTAQAPFFPSTTAPMPAGNTLQNFLVAQSASVVYVASGDSTSTTVEFGSIPLGGGAYTKIVDVTYPSATYFSAEGRGTMTVLDGKLYVGMQASFAGSTPYQGVVEVVDPVAMTATPIWNESSVHVDTMTADATRVFWSDGLGTLHAYYPTYAQDGTAASIPQRAYAYVNHGGVFYGASSNGYSTSFFKTTLPAGVAVDGSGVTTALGSVVVCPLGHTSCVPKVPTVAVDASYGYFTDADTIYKVAL